MKQINKYLQSLPKVKRATSERAELIDFFTTEVNIEREYSKRTRLPLGYFLKKLQGLELKDLYYLKSTCLDSQRRYGSFSKCFFGSLKVKPLNSDGTPE